MSSWLTFENVPTCFPLGKRKWRQTLLGNDLWEKLFFPKTPFTHQTEGLDGRKRDKLVTKRDTHEVRASIQMDKKDEKWTEPGCVEDWFVVYQKKIKPNLKKRFHSMKALKNDSFEMQLHTEFHFDPAINELINQDDLDDCDNRADVGDENGVDRPTKRLSVRPSEPTQTTMTWMDFWNKFIWTKLQVSQTLAANEERAHFEPRKRNCRNVVDLWFGAQGGYSFLFRLGKRERKCKERWANDFENKIHSGWREKIDNTHSNRSWRKLAEKSITRSDLIPGKSVRK